MSNCAQTLPRKAIIGLTILMTAGSGFALDPSKAITQYYLDVWTERDGLPQGTVQAITQTRDGYLWIGTRDGLARFDGVAFTVFRFEINASLCADDIRALREDTAGRLWIGTFKGGLSCYSESGGMVGFMGLRFPIVGEFPPHSIELTINHDEGYWLRYRRSQALR